MYINYTFIFCQKNYTFIYIGEDDNVKKYIFQEKLYLYNKFMITFVIIFLSKLKCRNSWLLRTESNIKFRNSIMLRQQRIHKTARIRLKNDIVSSFAADKPNCLE